MFPDRRTRVTSLCLLIVSLVGASGGGEEHRNSRSIEDRVSPRTGFNSYNYHLRERDSEGREVKRNGGPRRRRPNNEDRSTDDRIDSREFYQAAEEKLLEIVSKDYRGSPLMEIDRFDRIGDRKIARADISEDARRVVRQIKRHRPGLFWTLARVVFETVNETKSAIGQISDVVSNNFGPETTTQRGGGTSVSFRNELTRTMQPATVTNEASTRIPTVSSTSEEPFKLTPSELRGLIRRNLRGLVRLFDIEWRDALNQSHTNVRDFQRDLGNRISPFLQDNPDAV